MTYQEKYSITPSNSSFFSKQFDILITGYLDEQNERHTHFRELISDYNGTVCSIDTCENAKKLKYRITKASGELIDHADDKVLIPDLQKLMKKYNFEGANICMDITSLKQAVLFLLIKLLLKEIKPSRLFAAYTEPKGYKKRSHISVGETEEFDLYDRIIGSSNGVPGFYKSQSSNEILLIAPLGFDSQRLQYLFENIKPKKLIPIIGFPSFVPGWDLTAIKMNYIILKDADCFEMIKTCEAASPFEIIDILTEEFHRHNADYDIYVSPLGTRPHCLGAAIFVARNPSAYLIYDFPVEKQYRSEKVLRTNIYHLSKYIG